ncbi:hypothetical protein K438DRAFT_1764840 [Mycena galopus ATCC 62051]|nr:hypothetical protein K438DRAFT_1764840 [Mycena galopus ATCC 62051]
MEQVGEILMETKTHLLSEKERWNSRVSEKPKGERLSAREECKAKRARQQERGSKNHMRYLCVWRESFEQEILKSSGAEKRQQGAHTTESEGVVKEINEGNKGRAEDQQLKGSVWHGFVIGSAVSGITSGNISWVNYGVHQCACGTGLLRRAWRDGQVEAGSGATKDTRKELGEGEDLREASATTHHGVERSVQANEGHRINAVIINPEEEKDDLVPFAHRMIGAPHRMRTVFGPGTSTHESEAMGYDMDQGRLKTRARRAVCGVAEPRGNEGKGRDVTRTNGRREAIYGVAVTRRKEQGKHAHREPELSPRKRAPCEVEFRIGVQGLRTQSGETQQSAIANTTMSKAHTHRKKSLELSPCRYCGSWTLRRSCNISAEEEQCATGTIYMPGSAINGCSDCGDDDEDTQWGQQSNRSSAREERRKRIGGWRENASGAEKDCKGCGTHVACRSSASSAGVKEAHVAVPRHIMIAVRICHRMIRMIGADA